MNHPEYVEQEQDSPAVEAIICDNPLEEATRRYWRASSMWRDRIPCDWTVEQMINECHDVFKYRGNAPILMESLLHDVVHHEPAGQSSFDITTTTIELGQ
jgi:hypothetical protein